ncbi:lipase member H-like [Ostrinia nubilalis]|uniref:lipase member H-like n=1 Tax=Ostrinia nubilalis TaxID=29057 RepID=UPI003082300A
MFTGVFNFFVLIGLVLGDEPAKLRYFYSTIEEYTELPLERAQDIFSTSWYNASRTTVIFAHGFTGHPQGPAVTAVINSYLEQGKSNVVLFNWDKMASSNSNMVSSYLSWAAPNAKRLGYIFSETLQNMSAAGLALNKTHLVGHSLGAHIFGIAGNTLLTKGIQLPWITGLDPASASFENRPKMMRLNPESASFVSVIHSDPSKYACKKPLGTVDFWPNFRPGTVVQPGCSNKSYPMFSKEDLCNHNRSWELLIDAIKYPGTILGSYAKNYRQWKNSSKEEKEATVLEIGIHKEDPVPGDYFFITTAESPYGLGKQGL